MSFLYILNRNLFLSTWFVNIFSHFVDRLFTLLIVSFVYRIFFGLMQFCLAIFAFVACACGVISRKSWPKLMSGRFSFYFLFFFSLAMLQDMWNLSSLTRSRTHAPCRRSTEPYPLDHQGGPPFIFF